MKRLAVALAAAALCLPLAGCKNPCLKLAEKICECQTTTTLRDECNARASDEQSRVTITPADETVCTDLYADCDCHALDTVEGKTKCGLARSADWKPAQ